MFDNTINYEIYKNDHFGDKVNLYPMYSGEDAARFVLDLRNGVRYTCFDNRIIGWDEHIEYWKDNFFFYLMIGDRYGYVKIKDNELSIVLETKYRNKGIGQEVVKKVLKYYPDLVVEVVPDNFLGQTFFEKCGFKLKRYVYDKK